MIKMQKYDIAGILLSTICGLHCILTPIILIKFPDLGHKIESPWLQSVLLLLIAGIFYQAIYRNFKVHKSKLTLGLGLLGFMILLGAYINETFLEHADHHHHGAHDETTAIIFAITGSVLMISSHILNIKHCKCGTKN